MGRVMYYLVAIVAMAIGGVLGREFPAVPLQWVATYILYYVGKMIAKKFPPIEEKDKARAKWSKISGFLGILGLLSPILGLVFALPAFVIAEHCISTTYKGKQKIIYFTGAMMIMCVINANIGSIIHATNN